MRHRLTLASFESTSIEKYLTDKDTRVIAIKLVHKIKW